MEDQLDYNPRALTSVAYICTNLLCVCVRTCLVCVSTVRPAASTRATIAPPNSCCLLTHWTQAGVRASAGSDTHIETLRLRCAYLSVRLSSLYRHLYTLSSLYICTWIYSAPGAVVVDAVGLLEADVLEGLVDVAQNHGALRQLQPHTPHHKHTGPLNKPDSSDLNRGQAIIEQARDTEAQSDIA